LPLFDLGQRLRDVWGGTATSLLPADDLFSEELFSLSPLTSPDSTPSSTPKVTAVDLPDVETTPAMEPLLVEKVAEALTPLEKKKRRMKARSKKNKKRKRFLAKVKKMEENQFQDGPAVREKAKLKYLREADLLFTMVDTEGSHVTKSAYASVNTTNRAGFEVEYGLNDLVGEDSRFKFALKKWDGK
jgi:hypothetical protein